MSRYVVKITDELTHGEKEYPVLVSETFRKTATWLRPDIDQASPSLARALRSTASNLTAIADDVDARGLDALLDRYPALRHSVQAVNSACAGVGAFPTTGQLPPFANE